MAKLPMLGARIGSLGVRVPPPPKRADAELLTPEHRAWREAVCGRAGWRCEHVENGRRCERSRANGDRMIADHIKERADDGAPLDLANGACKCVQHNTQKGIAARAARASQTP